MSDFEKLGRRIAAVQDSDLRALGATERGAERFIQALRQKRRPRRVRLLWAAALVTAAIALPASVLVLRGPRPLVQSPAISVAVGRQFVVPKDQTVPLHFSDGSHLLLASRTRATVRELSPQGANVDIEGGEVQFSVVHRAETRWTVSAGPYRVHVTGTRFDLEWLPDADRFILNLQEGSVVVSTDNGSHAELRMVAPEHLRIDRGLWQLSPLQSDTPAAAAAAAATQVPLPTAPRTHALRGTARAPAPIVRAPAPAAVVADWQSLGRQGKFAQAYAAAEVPGISDVARTAAPSELLALAEVCRFSGHVEQGTSVLTTLRERFADREESSVAAFQLGRLSGDRPQAAAWFRTYLRERPQGALAREAAGRLLEALDHGGDRAGATAAAESYLESYPSGPHAAFARQVLGH
jgi:hypothetical protein